MIQLTEAEFKELTRKKRLSDALLAIAPAYAIVGGFPSSERCLLAAENAVKFAKALLIAYENEANL